jgi:penicillin-binding protein 2
VTKSVSTLVFRITLGVLLLVLVVALFRLQVVKGAYYQRIAESNFVRIRRIIATRGEIYDSKYRPIAANIPSQNLYLTSGKIASTERLAAFLLQHFGISAEELKELVFQQRFKSYEEILLAVNVPYETVLSLSERLDRFPELAFRVETTRSYMYPNHFTGYLGRIDQKEYQLYRDEDYSLNGYIGKTGLERYYEVLLRGKDGKEIVQVDAQGRSLEFFREDTSIEPLNGLSLVLSIDNDLQNYADGIFPDGLKGCIVVSDVKTGGILAYVSKPDYDPNVFLQRISPEQWAELNSSSRPLLDRIIHATYPPGSVFKPVTGAEGLEAGLIDRHTRLASCRGGLKIGNRFFRCWSSGGHGSLDIVNAFKVSCDVFFYDLINKANLDNFYRMAVACGVVNKTGIDLPNERNGFYPDSRYYQKKLGRTAGLAGYKANLAIGQGEVLTTPLQINAFFAAIARNGLWVQPHLLVKTMGRSKLAREEVVPIAKHKLPWKPSTVQIIQDGLWAVCNAPGGTARVVSVAGAQSYGKTGSAENFMGKRTHAWFSGYIVKDNPEIVVTVFLENAGGGGAMAAPIANRIFNYYIGNYARIKQPAVIPPQFQTPGDLDTGDAAATESAEPVPDPAETTPAGTEP